MCSRNDLCQRLYIIRATTLAMNENRIVTKLSLHNFILDRIESLQILVFFFFQISLRGKTVSAREWHIQNK